MAEHLLYGSRRMSALHRPITENDSELVIRCQRGDELAFRALLDKHRDGAYWLAYDILNDRDLAVDVLQEAFIRVFRGIKDFNPKNSFEGWLYRIVTNLSIDFLRTKSRRRDSPFGELQEIAEDTAVTEAAYRAVEAEEERALVHEVLSMLPTKYRIVLSMRDLQGMSFQEISRALSSPCATIRWRLHKARKMFKELWKKKVEGNA